MKKRNLWILLLSLVLAGCMGVGLVACGDKPDDTTTPQYTVTFSLGEYTGDESAPDPITVDAGDDITLPDVEISWDEHVFSGWKEGSEGSLLEAGSTYTVTKSTTLTAQWEDDIDETSYIVNYIVDGVNISTTMGGPYAEGEVGTAIGTLPTEDDIKDWISFAYEEFKGWSTVEDSEDDIVDENWEPAAGRHFLYAIFTGVSNEAPTLYFYADADATGTPITVTPEWKKPVDEDWAEETWCFTIPACSFTNGDNEFVCWYYHADAPMGVIDVELQNFDWDGYTGLAVVPDDFASGEEYKFFAKWDDGTATNPPTGDSEWVEFTGEVDADPNGYYYLLSPIVYISIDVNGVDPTLTYKVKGDSTEYTATAVPDQNVGNKLCYKLTDFGSGPYSVPHILVELSTDKTELDIYTTQGDKCGTLTVGGGTPGPIEPPPAGDKYTVSYAFATNSSYESKVVGTLPDPIEATAGETVYVPTVDWTFTGYRINYWRVQYYIQAEDYWDAVPGIGNLQSGDSFTMPSMNVRIAAVWTNSPIDITIIYDANGGSGTMANGTVKSNASLYVPETCSFTAPGIGQTLAGWSLTADCSSGLIDTAVSNGNWVSYIDNNTVTLYAIWTIGGNSGNSDVSSINDIVGKWSTELDAGNHTITVIAKAGANDIVGYAVLDGKTFITIYNEDGTLVASNTDDKYVTNYTFALSEGTFTLKEIGENTYNFTKQENIPSTSEETFLGKWKRSATQRVLIAEDGVSIYSYNGLKVSSWLIVGEYLVFSYPLTDASDSSVYYYILTKTTDGLKGFFLMTDQTQVEATFTANGFYTLAVDGEYVEFVNEGSKPTAIAEPTAPSGKKFDGWVLVGTETPFDFNENMTADASIEAKFVDDNGSEEPEPTPAGEYTGGTFTIKTSATKSSTITSFTFSANYSTVTLYLQDGTTKDYTLKDVSSAGWLEGDAKGVAVYELQDYNQFSYYFAFTDASMNTVKVCDEDYELLATFTKAGGSESGGDQPSSGSVITFVGNWSIYGSNVKIEINLETNEFTFTVNGTPREPVTATVIEAGASWSIMGINNPAGSQRWFKIDGDQLKIYDSSWMDPEDLEATFEKA